MRAILLSLLLICSNAMALVGTWKSGSVVTNPTSATVFVSVTLPASGSKASPASGNYKVGLWLYCSVAETYELQVLNASSVVQATIPIACSASQPNFIPAMDISFPIQDGWIIQVIPAVGFTGSGSAQLFYALEGLN
jgi:hypothetical protein